ncbi:MAG: metallophosphoesterase [Actinomycetia bacterium]|nr:metallophosphoesterase [Actinomycetes bacterium]
MSTWYSADLHLGHANILEYCDRPYASVAEMNERLLANWNAVVAPDDLVWVLGDFDMRGKDASLALLPRLMGTKVLVAGNHDACWAGDRAGWKHMRRYLEAGFAAVHEFARTTLPARRPNQPRTPVLLSHFPYEGDSHEDDRYSQFRLRDEGVTLLHGHVHDAFREARTPRGALQVNVGVDVWDYAPVSENTLAAHIASLAADY